MFVSLPVLVSVSAFAVLLGVLGCWAYRRCFTISAQQLLDLPAAVADMIRVQNPDRLRRGRLRLRHLKQTFSPPTPADHRFGCVDFQRWFVVGVANSEPVELKEGVQLGDLLFDPDFVAGVRCIFCVHVHQWSPLGGRMTMTVFEPDQRALTLLLVGFAPLSDDASAVLAVIRARRSGLVFADSSCVVS